MHDTFLLAQDSIETMSQVQLAGSLVLFGIVSVTLLLYCMNTVATYSRESVKTYHMKYHQYNSLKRKEIIKFLKVETLRVRREKANELLGGNNFLIDINHQDLGANDDDLEDD